MRLEPKPEMFPPHSLFNLVQGVGAKHFIQRHVKAKVVKECILHVHQHPSITEATITPPTETPRIDWVMSVFLIALADVCSLALAINVRVLSRERFGWVVPHKSQSTFAGTRQIGHLNSDCTPRISARRVLGDNVSGGDNVESCGGPTTPRNLQRVWR